MERWQFALLQLQGVTPELAAEPLETNETVEVEVVHSEEQRFYRAYKVPSLPYSLPCIVQSSRAPVLPCPLALTHLGGARAARVGRSTGLRTSGSGPR